MRKSRQKKRLRESQRNIETSARKKHERRNLVCWEAARQTEGSILSGKSSGCLLDIRTKPWRKFPDRCTNNLVRSGRCTVWLLRPGTAQRSIGLGKLFSNRGRLQGQQQLVRLRELRLEPEKLDRD